MVVRCCLLIRGEARCASTLCGSVARFAHALVTVFPPDTNTSTQACTMIMHDTANKIRLEKRRERERKREESKYMESSKLQNEDFF